MSVRPKTVRSSASFSRPSLRTANRPQPRGRETFAGSDIRIARREKIVSRIRSRSVSVMHIAAALMILIAGLIGSLILRTQMAANSFEISETEKNISRLTQDIQDDRAKLESLSSSLPDKANGLGMVAGNDSVTVNMEGYRQ